MQLQSLNSNDPPRALRELVQEDAVAGRFATRRELTGDERASDAMLHDALGQWTASTEVLGAHPAFAAALASDLQTEVRRAKPRFQWFGPGPW